MPNCYQCGRRIPSPFLVRRKVKIGEYIRASYRNGKVETVQKSYGQRVVCQNCAKRIDRQHRGDELKQLLGSILVLLAIVSVYLWQTYLAQ